MATNADPRILEEIQAIGTHIAATEDRLLSEMCKMKDDLKSDIAGLATSVGRLETRMDSLEGRLLAAINALKET